MSRALRFLVALRFAIGRPFGWDAPGQSIDAHLEASYARRVGPELASRSRVAVGTREGAMRVLYVLERERWSRRATRPFTPSSPRRWCPGQTATGYTSASM
jgi:hypothetical protein